MSGREIGSAGKANTKSRLIHDLVWIPLEKLKSLGRNFLFLFLFQLGFNALPF